MNKSEICQAIAEQYGLHPKEVHITITKFLELITEDLEATGGPVKLHNFGRFEVKSLERNWRNPRTGEKKGVETRKRIAFTPSHGLRTKLNEQRETENGF